MPGHTRGRKERGRLQNIANQLANLTVGWEFMGESRTLEAAPDVGTLALDIRGNSAAIDGQAVDSAMLSIARHWLSEELMRLRRNPDWVQSATVDITYEIRRDPPTHDPSGSVRGIVNLHAAVHVVTGSGEADATFANSQSLHDPGEDPPLTTLYRAMSDAAFEARSRVDWRDRGANPERHSERLAEVALYQWIIRFLQGRPSPEPVAIFEHRPTAAQLRRALASVRDTVAALGTGQIPAGRTDWMVALHREALVTTRHLEQLLAGLLDAAAQRPAGHD